MNPALKPSIVLAPDENGYVAYDPIADRLHTLNPLGALITELCDGSRNVDQIRVIVGPLLPEGQSAAVVQWIAQAIEAGLLVSEGTSGDAHRELSAKELFDLAHRLQDGGKRETALIVERRVTELAPENPTGWYYLGELALINNRRDESRAAYEKYLALKPDDEEISHILIALRNDAPPPRMSNECVVHIYKDFAATYESNVVGDLGYKGPQRLHEMLTPLLEGRRPASILDLGCGSGLAAVEFKPRASRLVGLDLSPEMVQLARARNLYDELSVAEITAWLDDCTEQFELALACDCLIYFGDLNEVTTRIAKVLKPKGLFAFTLERGEQYPYKLTDSGRYSHHADHFREAAAKGGLSVARHEEGFLRTEYGMDVIGHYVVLEKK